MSALISNVIGKLYVWYHHRRLLKRWAGYRRLGMHLGKDVNIPWSTSIDSSHCFLISIGDNCGFGENCTILAHDAMPNEYLDASVIGRVKIHESCHFGVNTIILPGVEIGPRCIIGSGSVVIKSIPPDTVAAGNPAKVLCTMDEFLAKHRERMKSVPNFEFKKYDITVLTPERRDEMVRLLDSTIGYMVGGYTAMVEEGASLFRTPDPNK
jgi:maltose O-acetyltransferase